MPLKPIYKRAPLLPLQQAILNPGQVITNNHFVLKLYQYCCEQKLQPGMLEGVLGLCCLTQKDPMSKPVVQSIRSFLEELDKENNAIIPFHDQIAIARSALLLFEYSGERAIITRLLNWCSRVEKQWDELIEDNYVRQHPADMMEFLVKTYRLTGSKGILRLCTRLRARSMDWTSILQTFDQKRGLKKQIQYQELINNVTREGGNDETAFYTRLYLTNIAANFADGVRYSTFSSEFSGNGQETSAGEHGWEIAKKYHGAVCGGTTADAVLQGQGSNRAIDTVSLAAWCEALCHLYIQTSKTFLLKDLANIAMNAIPAVVGEEGLEEYQAVNQLNSRIPCYTPNNNENHKVECLSRLSRAIDLLWRTAVTEKDNGICFNLMLQGHFALRLNGVPCILMVEDSTIHIKLKNEVHASIFFASPNDIDLCVSKESPFRVNSGARVQLERNWQKEEMITVTENESVRSVEGHHHSASIRKGNIVYAIKADQNDFAWALVGEPTEKDGKVYGSFKKVKVWDLKDGHPLNVAIYPETEGNTVEKELYPYADLKNKITVFPRGKEN